MTLNNPDNDRAKNIFRNIRTVRERGFSMGPGPGGEDEPMWLLFRNRWIHHVMTFKKETVELNICENMVLKMVSEFGLKFRQYCLTSVKTQMGSRMTVIKSNGFRLEQSRTVPGSLTANEFRKACIWASPRTGIHATLRTRTAHISTGPRIWRSVEPCRLGKKDPRKTVYDLNKLLSVYISNAFLILKVFRVKG